METLKTAVVVVLLLAVLYGVYLILNKPSEPVPLADEWRQEEIEPLQVDLGGMQVDASEVAGTSGPSDTEFAAVPEVGSGSGASDLPPWAAQPASMPADQLTAPPSEWTEPEVPDTAQEFPPPQQWPEDTAQANAPSEPTAPVADGTASQEETPADPPVFSENTESYGSAAPVDSYRDQAQDGSSDLAAVDSAPTSFSPFENAIKSAQSKVESGDWHDALWTLSLFYGSPDLNQEQQERLQNWLDPLAAKVIYSREHLIEQAYEVQDGETLQSIAESFSVPWQLLANINGFGAGEEVQPGTMLKVVRGPLRAEIDLDSQHLTVFAGKLYAGQFPISVGEDPRPQPGEYRVLEKLGGRTYYAGDGQTIPPAAATNPYGEVWIGLGGDISIHGRPAAAGTSAQGCISLEPTDANDVFGILSQGSTVSILR